MTTFIVHLYNSHMKVFEFNKYFPDEAACLKAFKEMRDKDGVVCQHCGSHDVVWLESKQQYQCKHCRHRTTLWSGTVMHGSKLPFMYWFIAMHLLTATKKSKVLVIAESTEAENPKRGQKPKEVGHIKMIVVPNLKKETIDGEAVNAIEPDSSITTDASKSHNDFKLLFGEHKSQVINPKDIGKVLPWVHIAISNAKTKLADMHHGIKPEFLQEYLNEFCYKFNRRYFGENLFERLVKIAASYRTDFEHKTYRKTA